MKSLEEIYKDSFFRKRFTLHWRAPIFCQAVIDVLNPESVVDVGCATGDLVRQFRQMGVPCEGLEGSEHVIKHSVIDNMILWDLRCSIKNRWNDFLPGETNKRFNLCICLEVAEHIEPEYVNIFLENLIFFSNKILMSIAPPGQKGHYHVNLQPIEYWDKLLLELGYVRKQKIADQIKEKIYSWRNKPGIKAFWQNLVYYEKTPISP
jgi:hypothetical protein